MPEGPEVETVVRTLSTSALIGRTICHSAVLWPRTVAPLLPADFNTAVVNQTVSAIERQAKYIVFKFISGLHLVTHLRMSGRLLLLDSSASLQAYERLISTFDDQRQLRFYDPRKFGRCQIVADLKEKFAHLGPDPLNCSFHARDLAQIIQSKKRPLKALLLDQQVLTGIGNIYADEILWQAKIHPLRLGTSLLTAELNNPYTAIGAVLKRAIANKGTSLGVGKSNFYSANLEHGTNQQHLNVYRRQGQACLRCATSLVKARIAQRGTHFCPHCQTQ